MERINLVNPIELGACEKKYLINKFGVTRQTIWNALEGKVKSKKAQRIRKEALKLGGWLVED